MFLDDCDYYCNNAYCHAVTMPVVLNLLYARVLVISLGAQSRNVIVQQLHQYCTIGTTMAPLDKQLHLLPTQVWWLAPIIPVCMVCLWLHHARTTPLTHAKLGVLHLVECNIRNNELLARILQGNIRIANYILGRYIQFFHVNSFTLDWCNSA